MVVSMKCGFYKVGFLGGFVEVACLGLSPLGWLCFDRTTCGIWGHLSYIGDILR